jgi:hypothetical protein
MASSNILPCSSSSVLIDTPRYSSSTDQPRPAADRDPHDLAPNLDREVFVNRPSYRTYQYRPDKQPRDLETLLASRLWSASIESLNDPFEFQALRGLASQPEMQAEFKRAGVTCFCRALTNPLLWSHYAGAHT